jgi:uncharacterized DUF497 family protein
MAGRKHGITFEEAETAVLDPNSYVFDDPVDPDRAIVIGMSSRARLLVVVECETKDGIVVISARNAARSEREIYAQRG